MNILKFSLTLALVLVGIFIIFRLTTNTKVQRVFGTPPLRDYQLELYMDTMWLYDGDRLVGRWTDTAWNTPMDSLIMKDNQ